MCVLGCRHPIYGGHGTCIPSAHVAGGECLCGASYRNHDDLYQAACQPKGLSRTVHCMVCGVGLITLLHGVYQKRKLQAALRMTPTTTYSSRNNLRCHLTSCLQLWGASTSIIFAVEAALDLPFWILSLASTLPMVTTFVACCFIQELWVLTLPRKLLQPGTAGYRMSGLATDKRYTTVFAVVLASITAGFCILGGTRLASPLVTSYAMMLLALFFSLLGGVVINTTCWSLYATMKKRVVQTPAAGDSRNMPSVIASAVHSLHAYNLHRYSHTLHTLFKKHSLVLH